MITIMLTEIKMEIWRVKKTNTLVKMRRRSETKKKVINRNLGSTSRNIDLMIAIMLTKRKRKRATKTTNTSVRMTSTSAHMRMRMRKKKKKESRRIVNPEMEGTVESRFYGM